MTTAPLEYALPSRRGRPAVVAPPHPLYGGRLDHPVLVALAEALGECGYAPVRFNWRGIGSSAGNPSGRLEEAVEDYASALAEARRLARENGLSGAVRALAAGYSFGAVTAAEIACRNDAEIERLVLVAPPVTMLQAVDVASVPVPIQVIVGASDSFAPAAELARVLECCEEVRIDVIPDADHFFARTFWVERVGELVRTALR